MARHQEDRRRVANPAHGAGPPPVTHPDFGSYATLKCGTEYQRQRIAWLRWMAGQFTSHQAAKKLADRTEWCLLSERRGGK